MSKPLGGWIFFGGLDSRSSRVDGVFGVLVSRFSSLALDFGVLVSRSSWVDGVFECRSSLVDFVFWWFAESKQEGRWCFAVCVSGLSSVDLDFSVLQCRSSWVDCE